MYAMFSNISCNYILPLHSRSLQICTYQPHPHPQALQGEPGLHCFTRATGALRINSNGAGPNVNDIMSRDPPSILLQHNAYTLPLSSNYCGQRRKGRVLPKPVGSHMNTSFPSYVARTALGIDQHWDNDSENFRSSSRKNSSLFQTSFFLHARTEREACG